MGGSWPTRANRTSFGERYENTYPVNNPKKEIGAPIFNLNFWAVAGLCKTGCMAAIRATVSGSTITVPYFGLACSPNESISPITFTYMGVGCYFFEFDTEYNDEDGTARTFSLSHGIVMPTNGENARGAHTGSNNASILTDSTKSWATNEHVGRYIYNLTDGSRALITANTTDTVTGTLAGGSDNDWDTTDVYRIIGAPALIGQVNLNTARSGDVMFFDSSGALADPPGFALALW